MSGTGFEYRVVWRREYDKRKRTRIYQTQSGAEDFAHFLKVSSWDEIDDMEVYAILDRYGFHPTESA